MTPRSNRISHLQEKIHEKAKLCNMDTYSFIVHVKTKDIYKDKDAEKKFD